jgi:hypothetical protein
MKPVYAVGGLVKPVVEPGVGEVIARAVRGPARRINLAVGFDDGPLVVNFAHALAQIAEKLVEGLELFLGGFSLVENTDEANAYCNVIEVVTVDMASVDLLAPAAANFDLSIA